jgi:hypothetical protein
MSLFFGKQFCRFPYPWLNFYVFTQKQENKLTKITRTKVENPKQYVSDERKRTNQFPTFYNLI